MFPLRSTAFVRIHVPTDYYQRARQATRGTSHLSANRGSRSSVTTHICILIALSMRLNLKCGTHTNTGILQNRRMIYNQYDFFWFKSAIFKSWNNYGMVTNKLYSMVSGSLYTHKYVHTPPLHFVVFLRGLLLFDITYVGVKQHWKHGQLRPMNPH